MALTKEVIVEANKQKVWLFLQDTEAVAKCIPGTESVSIVDEYSSKWKLKIGVGMISRRIDARVRRSIDEVLYTMSFDVLSTDGDLEAKIAAALEDSLPGKTLLRIEFDAKARGSFSWIVNQIITKQSDKMITEFIDCINASIAT